MDVPWESPDFAREHRGAAAAIDHVTTGHFMNPTVSMRSMRE
jgi:hypothetical protein